MPFLGPIVATIDTDTATLLEPLVYRGKTDTFTVPAGAKTDFASVPRAFTWLVPKMGIWTKGAVLHDELCDLLEAGDERVSARDVDAILRRVMRELGASLVSRWLVWVGVRWGALANPARRPGWWRDAPAVLSLSALVLPLLLPAAIAVLLTLAIDHAVEAILR